jgi:nucleotidyltransferase/DNA polymerase involved in DNA repair
MQNQGVKLVKINSSCVIPDLTKFTTMNLVKIKPNNITAKLPAKIVKGNGCFRLKDNENSNILWSWTPIRS